MQVRSQNGLKRVPWRSDVQAEACHHKARRHAKTGSLAEEPSHGVVRGGLGGSDTGIPHGCFSFICSGGMAVAASRVVSVAIYKIGDAVRKITDTSDKATITEWVGPPRRSRRLRKRMNCKWC